MTSVRKQKGNKLLPERVQKGRHVFDIYLQFFVEDHNHIVLIGHVIALWIMMGC